MRGIATRFSYVCMISRSLLVQGPLLDWHREVLDDNARNRKCQAVRDASLSQVFNSTCNSQWCYFFPPFYRLWNWVRSKRSQADHKESECLPKMSLIFHCPGFSFCFSNRLSDILFSHLTPTHKFSQWAFVYLRYLMFNEGFNIQVSIFSCRCLPAPKPTFLIVHWTAPTLPSYLYFKVTIISIW